MTAFILAALTLVVVVLAVVLPPLLRRRAAPAQASRAALNASIYRDELAELEGDLASGSLAQNDFDAAKRELARRLLEDAQTETSGAAPAPASARRSALALAVGLPVAAALIYLALGNVAALSPEAVRPPQVSAQQINEMVAKLAARMEQHPEDLKGWAMLARSYKALGRYDEAVRAFDKAGALVDENAQLLSEYAEALAISGGGSLRGKPTQLVERALKLDPDHPQALVLAGTAAYERQDFGDAANYWEKVLRQLPADSEDAQSLAESIKKARDAQAQRKKPGNGAK